MATISKRAFSEFLGTCALVFFGCGSIMVVERFPHTLNPAGIPVVFGLVILAMIYGLGHISGAHMNPAVTLGFAISRHFPFRDVLTYWVMQCAGAFAAIFLLQLLLPAGTGYGATLPSLVTNMQAFGWEVFITYILMFVVMAVATDTRAIGTMAGAAIGGTVILEAFVAGPVTGCGMNPARSLAPAIFEGRVDVLWIYILAPMLGAALASLSYQWVRGKEVK